MNSRLQWDRNKIMAYLKEHFDKYKYILIVCICGLALACFPSAERGDEEARDVESVLTADVSALEAQLEEALSAITGVGRVTVVLTAKSSSQAVYAYDEDKTVEQTETQRNADTRTSLVSVGSGNSQQPVRLRTDEPEYRGALIVCQGGDSAVVRLEITRAVSALTGITSDNIVVAKMKN